MHQDTRAQLLTEAEAAVRRVGYAGFSYADLANHVGIRKPSIHHHFPLKEDLGAALVETYTDRFREALDNIAAAAPHAPQRLAAYATLYRVGLEAGQGCLCGVLASELAGLPERVRAGVRRFFEVNAEWLAAVIAEGQAVGSIRSDVDAHAQAAAILAALEGAMLVGRALGSVDAFDAATATLWAGLQVPAR
jgi:TetR/AcrR family transcriptional repressor of nem operon